MQSGMKIRVILYKNKLYLIITQYSIKFLSNINIIVDVKILHYKYFTKMFPLVER